MKAQALFYDDRDALIGASGAEFVTVDDTIVEFHDAAQTRVFHYLEAWDRTLCGQAVFLRTGGRELDTEGTPLPVLRDAPTKGYAACARCQARRAWEGEIR